MGLIVPWWHETQALSASARQLTPQADERGIRLEIAAGVRPLYHDICSSGSACDGRGANARVRQVRRRGVPGADSDPHAAPGAAEHHGPRVGRAAAARRHGRRRRTACPGSGSRPRSPAAPAQAHRRERRPCRRAAGSPWTREPRSGPARRTRHRPSTAFVPRPLPGRSLLEQQKPAAREPAASMNQPLSSACGVS